MVRSGTPALTVRQPWASAILYLGKDVENRTWPTYYRGKLYIHAGQKLEWDAPGYAWPEGWPSAVNMLPGGAIIGYVTLRDCTMVQHEPRSRWATAGRWHWWLADPIPLERPVTCSGHRGLWTPDPIVRAYLEEAT
jgi:hypothetical protein